VGGEQGEVFRSPFGGLPGSGKRVGGPKKNRGLQEILVGHLQTSEKEKKSQGGKVGTQTCPHVNRKACFERGRKINNNEKKKITRRVWGHSKDGGVCCVEKGS